MICKFRSMKMPTPHDTLTHLLENPNQYIARVECFVHRTGLDEFPHIYQVFTSKLSVIGSRQTLWSQEDLVAEREEYGANDIKPGITRWVQTNGCDELVIDVKAKFDGEYAAVLNTDKFKEFTMDVKCLFGTSVNVLKSDGVVKGGTGKMKKQEKNIEQEVTRK